jgi:rhodanese-related sulfurtransferase
MIAALAVAWLVGQAGAPVAAIQATAATVPSVDTAELSDLIKTDANLLLIDFRSAEQYEDGHLPFAINVPWDSEKQSKSEEKLFALLKTRPRPIVLYGVEAITLSQIAQLVKSKNAGKLSIYPAGTDGWADYEGGYLELEWEGLWRALTTDTPTILDVRKIEKYRAGHIPGAKFFDPQYIDMKALAASPWINLKKEAGMVIAYCDGTLCGLSRKAAEALSKSGVKSVYLYPGGYPEWVDQTNCIMKD